MRRVLIVPLALLGLVLPTLAQTEDAPPQRERERDRAGWQGRGGRGGGGGEMRGGRRGGGRFGMMRMLRQLPAELEMTAEQRELYLEIADKYRNDLEGRDGRREEMRELARAYREARRSGDDEAAEEIREQMRELGQERLTMVDDFLNEVTTILDEEQVARLSELRERIGQRGRGRGPGGMRRMIRELPDALEMTEEQRAAFEVMVADQREAFRENRMNWRELRPLIQEMREAREAGDDERAAEIEAELRSQREQMGGSLEDFLDRLKGMLTEEQQTRLAELRAQYERGGRRQSQMDPKEVVRVARRLKLNTEQRDQLRDIQRDVFRATRGRLGRDELNTVAQETKKQILEILDEEQQAEFERLLDDDGRRGRGRGEMRRGRGGGGFGDGDRERGGRGGRGRGGGRYRGGDGR